MTTLTTPDSGLTPIDEKACLDFLAQMVRHKSYSQTDGERALAAYMVDRMREIGMTADATPVEGTRVNAIGTWKGTGGGKSLLFNGHLDTNPVSEGWTVDPWGGKVDDKFIYGIGVSNMKAGDAAYYCAVKSLIDAGVRLKGDVILTFVVGELQGGVGTLAAIRQGVKRRLFHQQRADRPCGADHARRGLHLHHRAHRHHPPSVEARGSGRRHHRRLRSHPAPQRHDLLRRQERGASPHQPRPCRRGARRARQGAA